jgi:hypothetical protein
MQELNEENIFDIQDVFGANLNASKMGIKKQKNAVKSQLFDYLKRNKVQNPEQVIKQTSGELIEKFGGGVGVGEAGGAVAGEVVGDIMPFLDSSNKTGAKVVVVANPAGSAYTSPSSGFGMGFALDPKLVPNVSQFVNFHADKGNKGSVSNSFEQERLEDTDTPEELSHITWQKMNNAVANYVSKQLKQTLQKYHAYLPDEMYHNRSGTPAIDSHHYDPYSRQVYMPKKFNSKPQI